MKTLVLAIATLLLATVLVGLAAFADAMSHGPYTTWHNDRCLRLARLAGLVGRPEADVPAVLGPPSSIWKYGRPSGPVTTYNYDPIGVNAGIFQVHCQDGVVKRLEPFDDCESVL